MTRVAFTPVCATCDWRPPDPSDQDALLTHTRTEHPQQVTKDGEPEPKARMDPMCPRCSALAVKFHSRDNGKKVVHSFECLTCKRYYTLTIRR